MFRVAANRGVAVLFGTKPSGSAAKVEESGNHLPWPEPTLNARWARRLEIQKKERAPGIPDGEAAPTRLRASARVNDRTRWSNGQVSELAVGDEWTVDLFFYASEHLQPADEDAVLELKPAPAADSLAEYLITTRFIDCQRQGRILRAWLLRSQASCLDISLSASCHLRMSLRAEALWRQIMGAACSGLFLRQCGRVWSRKSPW
jgi:hypothetical protein